MANTDKEKLNKEKLEQVSGGAGETFDPERFQEFWNEKVAENDITKIPDTSNPHSKKAKGKLFK